MATIKEVIPLDSTSLSGVPFTGTEAGWLGDGAITDAGIIYTNACVVVDGNKDITGFRNIGATGTLTVPNITMSGTLTGGTFSGTLGAGTALATPEFTNTVSGDGVLSALDGSSTAGTLAYATAVEGYVDDELANLTDITLNGTTTIDNAVNFNGLGTTAANAIDWASYNRTEKSLGTNQTYTFSNPPAGPTNLIVIFNFTGTATVTLPTIKWLDAIAPDIDGINGEEWLVSLYYDGSSYYGSAGLFG
jgi:hypothetical protein